MKIRRTFAIPLIALGLLALLPAAGARAQSGPPSSVAFQSSRGGSNDIYVMNPDGSGQIPITTGASNDQRADISPDGRKIAFASNRSGGHFEIFVMNSDGSDVRQLTSTPAGIQYLAAMVAERRLDRVSVERQRCVSNLCDSPGRQRGKTTY